jgi:hypothetical protein
MYVSCNNEACSCKHCCSGKAVLHTLCICSLRHPACIAHTLFCHMWPTALDDVLNILKRHDFRKIFTEQTRVSDFLYNFCPKHFSFYEELSEIG